MQNDKKEGVTKLTKKQECPYCSGTGIFISIEPECCGNYEDCRGCFIPKQVQEQCNNCEATGYLREG